MVKITARHDTFEAHLANDSFDFSSNGAWKRCVNVRPMRRQRHVPGEIGFHPLEFRYD